MSYNFKKRLKKGLTLLDISLEDEAFAPLEVYFHELKKWGRKVNLIAKSSSDEQILENHFLDSLTLLPILQKEGAHLLDVGTGAGFPGLVCKAAWPQLNLTLVEPRQKRVSFLNHIVRTLHLENVDVACCRIEDEERLPSNLPFTHITSRAVSEIKTFVDMVMRFSSTGALVICMKGPKWKDEMAGAEQVVQPTYSFEQVVEHRLPFTGAQRALLVYAPQTTMSSG